MMATAKAAFYSNVIMNNKHNPRLLFETVNRLTQCQQPVNSMDLSAHDFRMHFYERVNDIRTLIPQSEVGGLDCAITGPSFIGEGYYEFEPIYLAELTKIVVTARETTCSLDPLPAWVVNELWPTLGLDVLAVLNLSLSTGVFPAYFKSAVVKPLLK